MKSDIWESCIKAEEYLLTYLSKHSCWEDFYIKEPGVSDEWIGAYIGNALLDSAMPMKERKRELLQKEAEWLVSKKHVDGGWGYNHGCYSDCDSTAAVIRFLYRLGYPIENQTLQHLASYWREDGGFCTYVGESAGSWNKSHIDVTVCAAPLLKSVFNKRENALQKEKLHTYISTWFQDHVLPPAFWWKSSCYTTGAALNCFEEFDWKWDKEWLKNAYLQEVTPKNCFDKALYLELLYYLDKENKQIPFLISQIQKEQHKDGSFNGADILRVTSTGNSTPWDNSAEDIYATDFNRLATTATVLRALGMINDAEE